MIDWNSANGLQLEMVQEALISAFPDPDDFNTFLLLRLNQQWVRLTGAGVTYARGIVQVCVQAMAAGWLGDLVHKAQQRVPGNVRLAALRQLGELTSVIPKTGGSLEDIVRQDGGFTDVMPWIDRLNALRGQVCRIEAPVGQGVGTGWLVDDDLVMTNGHVIAPILADQRTPTEYICRFDYATDAQGTNRGVECELAVKWLVGSSPASPLELGTGLSEATADELDFAVLRLATPIGRTAGPSGKPRGRVITRRGTAIPASGSILLVLQHPLGDPLKLAIGTALNPSANGVRIHHDANTINGSSGSPCFDARLDLVALHNSGDPAYNGIHGAPRVNGAVPLEPILARLLAVGAPQFWT